MVTDLKSVGKRAAGLTGFTDFTYQLKETVLRAVSPSKQRFSHKGTHSSWNLVTRRTSCNLYCTVETLAWLPAWPFWSCVPNRSTQLPVICFACRTRWASATFVCSDVVHIVNAETSMTNHHSMDVRTFVSSSCDAELRLRWFWGEERNKHAALIRLFIYCNYTSKSREIWRNKKRNTYEK